MKTVKRRIVSVLVIFVITLLLGACGILDDAAKLEVYDFGNDQIPSFTSIVGERKVTGVDTGSRTGGVTYKNYTYETTSLTEDVDAYFATLKDAGFLVTKASEGNLFKGTLEVGCNSTDEGQAILIGLDWDNTKLTVSIVKGDGSITAN